MTHCSHTLLLHPSQMKLIPVQLLHRREQQKSIQAMEIRLYRITTTAQLQCRWWQQWESGTWIMTCCWPGSIEDCSCIYCTCMSREQNTRGRRAIRPLFSQNSPLKIRAEGEKNNQDATKSPPLKIKNKILTVLLQKSQRNLHYKITKLLFQNVLQVCTSLI